MPKEYIEREKLLQDIEHYHLSDGKFQHWVEIQPAADVAPVQHGRWRWITYDANPKIGNWHCTCCNRIPKSFQKEDFCPNCGAKMDKEEV